jgi:hypothetical protein
VISLLSRDLFVGVTFVRLGYFLMICLLASPSCDFVGFTRFVSWRRLRATLLLSRDFACWTLLLSHDLFVGDAFIRLCLVVRTAFVRFHYFHAICLLASPSRDFVWL